MGSDESENLTYNGRNSAIAYLQSEDDNRIGYGLVASALNDVDWQWVEDVCLEHSFHKSEYVRSMALLGLGHLGRIHGAVINLERVIPRILECLDDEDTYVRDRSEHSLRDLQVFCGDQPYSRGNALHTLDCGTMPRKFITLYQMGREERDYPLSVNTLLTFSKNEHFALRAALIDGLAEVLCEREVVLAEEIKTMLFHSLRDDHRYVRSRARSLIESIKTFRGTDWSSLSPVESE